MKRIGDTGFFAMFDLAIGPTAKVGQPAKFTLGSAELVRSRHSHAGEVYDFTIEVTALSRSQKPEWNMLVAREYWWNGQNGEAIRAHRWAKVLSGSQAEIMRWLRSVQPQKPS